MEPSWIETINEPKCPKHNHGRMEHGLKCRIGHCTPMCGGIHKTCGIHQSTPIGGGNLSTKGSFAGDRGTQLTRLANIMRHTTVTQSHSCESFRFHVQKNLSLLPQVPSKKPVHCTAMIARRIDGKNADMECRAVPPPEYIVGRDSKLEELCQ